MPLTLTGEGWGELASIGGFILPYPFFFFLPLPRLELPSRKQIQTAALSLNSLLGIELIVAAPLCAPMCGVGLVAPLHLCVPGAGLSASPGGCRRAGWGRLS